MERRRRTYRLRRATLGIALTIFGLLLELSVFAPGAAAVTQASDGSSASHTVVAPIGPTAFPASATETCGLPGRIVSTVYLPNVTKTLGGVSGWFTPFYVQNTGLVETDVEISFYRFSDGSQVTCRRLSGLSPGETLVDNPNSDADLPDNTQFAVVVKSFGATVSAVVNQMQGSGATTEGLSYTGFTSGATTVYLPNVTRRFYGYDVPFIVQNLGDVAATVTASFISFDATQTFTATLQIQPGRSGVIDPDYTDGLVDLTQYAVKLTSSQPIGVVANAHNEAGSPVAFSHNGLSTGAATLYAPYAMKDGPGGLFSPIVVQNVGAAPADATIVFTPFGSAGTPQTIKLNGIGAGASRAFDPRFTVGTSTPCATASATCLGSGEYSVQITATGPVAAVVLPNSASTAEGYLASGGPQPNQFLPVVQRRSGATEWTGTIFVQSVTATAATVRFRTVSDFRYHGYQALTLTPGAATRIDPRSVPGLVDNTEYAVVIEAGSGTTIVSMVFQQGTSGGDASMIYTGQGSQASSAAKITGTVSGGGSGVPGVLVSASNTSGSFVGNSTLTDRTGGYALPLPNGSYVLTFTPLASSRFAIQKWPSGFLQSQATAVTVNGSDVTGISPTLVSGFAISGTITSQATGLPLAGSFGVAFPSNCFCTTALTAQADNSGNYRLIVPPGTYRVRFFRPAGTTYVERWWQNAANFSAGTDVQVSSDLNGISGSLSLSHRISGTVTNSFGAPVAGVSVSIRLGGPTRCCTIQTGVSTDSRGKYSAIVPAGTYRVAFFPAIGSGAAAGFYGAGATSFASSADVTVADVDLVGIDGILAPGHTISGTVTSSGQALSGASVFVYLASGTCCDNYVSGATTDANGRYSVSLADGTYRIFFVSGPASNPIFKWFSNASSYATATNVTLAGQNLTGIDAIIP